MKRTSTLMAAGILCVVGCTKQKHEDSVTVSFEMKSPQESMQLEEALTKLAAEAGLNEKTYSSHTKLSDSNYEVFDVEYTKYDPKYLDGILFQNNSTATEEQNYACLKIDIFVVSDENDDQLKLVQKKLNNFLRENIKDHRPIYVNTECGKRPHRFKD